MRGFVECRQNVSKNAQNSRFCVHPRHFITKYSERNALLSQTGWIGRRGFDVYPSSSENLDDKWTNK